MRSLYSLQWMLVLAACVTTLRASEEEFMAWQSITLKCANEKTPAGPVSCEITTGEAGYDAFVIRAFGQEFKLSADELAKLKGFPLSSLSTRHEAGYKELGGYSVHFRFQRASGKKTEAIYVTVTQKGVRVSDARSN